MFSNLEIMLFSLGVPTYTYDLATAIPVTASNKIQISKEMPKVTGWIYGLTVEGDGVDQDGNPLPTTTNYTNMYMLLKDGTSEFVQYLRLSDALNVFAGSPVIRPVGYLPVSFPGNFDISNSFYLNPTLIASAPAPAQPITIHMKWRYVTIASMAILKAHGFIFTPGQPMAHQLHFIKQQAAK